jgi:predicted dehydrogenase
MTKSTLSRRRFLASAAVAVTAAAASTTARRAVAATPAASKLNIGVIGVAGRGGDNLNGVSSENIVALCDVDERNLALAAQKFPGAATYRDFRRLMDRNDLDAIVVSTPDHTHAVAATRALRSGRHVYCEKPLTRTVSEARRVTELAAVHQRVTQIGTQIHAGNNYRRVVELVRSGAIGPISEVHVWAGASYGGKELPKDTPPVPPHLDFDLWLGPVPARPYHPDYAPFNWRHWWAFGGGSLADFGCHFMDLPFWALDLKYPTRIAPLDGPPVHPESTPTWLIARFEFPARGESPAVALMWYHGGRKPERLTPEQAKAWGGGVLFVGAKGELLADYGRHVLLPESKFADFSRPAESIPNSIGHHLEWINACKGQGTTTCPFSYSGPLTEAALLGNVAYRAGASLEWDAGRLAVANHRAAQALIHHEYREGWQL